MLGAWAAGAGDAAAAVTALADVGLRAALVTVPALVADKILEEVDFDVTLGEGLLLGADAGLE